MPSVHYPFPISQVSPQATGYLVKCVVESVITDGATSSGPHGISLSTTMDDDVFMDGTLREEVEQKTPDSQGEASEKSVVKVSPGAVRQEVSQAISDKKGALIIFREAEDKPDAEGKKISGSDENEEPGVPAELETDKKETETFQLDTFVVEGQTAEVKLLSPTFEIKAGDTAQIRGVDSPKKAMASWISKEEKLGVSEVISMSTMEVKENDAFNKLLQKTDFLTFEDVQSEEPKYSLTQVTVSDTSATSLAVVLYETNRKYAVCHPPFIFHSHFLSCCHTRLTAVNKPHA